MFLTRSWRSLVLLVCTSASLLTPTQADRGDAARFEAAVSSISSLSKKRPTVDQLLDSVREDVPSIRGEASTLTGLANYLAQTQDPKIHAAVIQAMLDSLDDRWAHLYTPTESQNMRDGLDGDGQGSIGVNLVADPVRKTAGFLITDVAPNGPSMGILKAGERLQKIDGVDLREAGAPPIDTLLHGLPGSVAHVTVTNRRGSSRRVDISRIDLDAPTAYVAGRDKLSTEIRVTSFGANTSKELKAILAKETNRSVVIDLRCNGGGYVKSAVECSSLFIKDGSLVVRTETPDGATDHLSEGAPIYSGNVCLLVNSKTASAAEIFTACLQHHLGAKVIGQTTYGKGSVQRIVDLPGDWALKVTTSAYRTAAGDMIDGIGISPDLLLEMPLASVRTDADTQMDQARMHLRFMADQGGPKF